jgi:CRISPR type III-A-associated protein Csm2
MQNNNYQQRTSQPGNNHQITDKFQDEEEGFRKKLQESFCESYENYILNNPIDGLDEYINKIKSYVKGHCNKISNSQLRNLFSEFGKRKDLNSLKRLRPILYYVAGRAKQTGSDNQQLKQLVYLLDCLVQKVNEDGQKESFDYFFESIVAYHKYFGGKNL